MTAFDPLRTLALRANSSEMSGRWLIVPLLIALAGCGRSPSDDLPATPLFVGVEGRSYAQGTQLIRHRLAAQFPAGSSVHELRNYLEQQGFQVERTAHSSTPNGGEASLKYGGPICGSQVRASWEADGAGKIESIDALYSDSGCP